MFTRRQALETTSLGALLLAAASKPSQAVEPLAITLVKRPVPGSHASKPLAFQPAKLRGISERLILSHHENNYGGALKNLNKVEVELAALAKDAPGFALAGLKQSELTYQTALLPNE